MKLKVPPRSTDPLTGKPWEPGECPVYQPKIGDRVRVKPHHGYNLHDPFAFHRTGEGGEVVTLYHVGPGFRLYFTRSDGRKGDVSLMHVDPA